MNRANGARPKNLKGTLKHLFKYLNTHVISLIIISVLVLIPAIATMFGTYSIRTVVNAASGNIPDYELIKNTCIKIGFLYALGVLASFTYMQMLAHLAQKITYELRRDLFSKMLRLPISYIDTHSYGNIMSLLCYVGVFFFRTAFSAGAVIPLQTETVSITGNHI